MTCTYFKGEPYGIWIKSQLKSRSTGQISLPLGARSLECQLSPWPLPCLRYSVLWGKTPCFQFPSLSRSFISTKPQLDRVVWGMGRLGMIWFSLWAQRRSPHSSPHTLFMVTSGWSPKRVTESPASSPGDYQAQMKGWGLSIWPMSAPLDSVWSYFLYCECWRKEFSSLKDKEMPCFSPESAYYSVDSGYKYSSWARLSVWISHLCRSSPIKTWASVQLLHASVLSSVKWV